MKELLSLPVLIGFLLGYIAFKWFCSLADQCGWVKS